MFPSTHPQTLKIWRMFSAFLNLPFFLTLHTYFFFLYFSPSHFFFYFSPSRIFFSFSPFWFLFYFPPSPLAATPMQNIHPWTESRQETHDHDRHNITELRPGGTIFLTKIGLNTLNILPLNWTILLNLGGIPYKKNYM